jgi:hypothetical protein
MWKEYVSWTWHRPCNACGWGGGGKLLTPSICYLILHSTMVHSTLGWRRRAQALTLSLSLSLSLSSLKIVQRQDIGGVIDSKLTNGSSARQPSCKQQPTNISV